MRRRTSSIPAGAEARSITCPTGSGKRGDRLHRRGDGFEPVRIEPQPVEHGGGEPVGLAGLHVTAVGGEDVALRRAQSGRGRGQRARLVGGAHPCQLPLRRAAGPEPAPRRARQGRTRRGDPAWSRVCAWLAMSQAPSSATQACQAGVFGGEPRTQSCIGSRLPIRTANDTLAPRMFPQASKRFSSARSLHPRPRRDSPGKALRLVGLGAGAH